MSTPTARLAMVTLDCADPEASAAFWSGLLGWDVAHAEKDYAMLTGPDHALGFGRVEDYEPPGVAQRAGLQAVPLRPRRRGPRRRPGGGGRARRHPRRPPARRHLARPPRPERPPLLPDQGRELGLRRLDRGDAGDESARHGSPEPVDWRSDTSTCVRDRWHCLTSLLPPEYSNRVFR